MQDDPCQGCVKKEIECITRFSKRTGLALTSCKHCMQKKVACWLSAEGRPTPAHRTAQRAKSQAQSRRVSSLLPKAEEDSPDLGGSPVMDTSLDNESPNIEPLPASPMSIVVDNDDSSGIPRPNTRARSAVPKRSKTPGPSHAMSRALSRVQPARVEHPEPAPGWSTRSTHQGSPGMYCQYSHSVHAFTGGIIFFLVPHGLLPSKQIYTQDSGSPAVLVENFFSRFEALERTVTEQSQTIVDQWSMIDSVVRMHEGLQR
jgi:hypothetical protein